MQTYQRRLASFCLFAALALPGCGGGSSNPSDSNSSKRQTTVTISILWGARSRVVSGPNSALSGMLTLKGAKPGGGDFTFPFERNDATLASYTQTYTTSNPALVGTWTATVTFFTNHGELGSLVGIAGKQVTLSVGSADIGDIATVGIVASITVPDPQTFATGLPADLVFTALDANGYAIAVTPGSALWTVNPSNAGVDASGHVLSSVAGDFTASVTMDGISSPLTHVHIAPVSMYTKTTIGTLPGDIVSFSYGLNGKGDVVGVSVGSPAPGQHAFFWTQSAGLQALGTLPGDTSSIAFGINGSDQVVGVSSALGINDRYGLLNPSQASHAFLWSSGKGMQSLPLSAAYGINDAGQVVGQVNNHAALWTPDGNVTDLGVLPGCDISKAIAINNAGQVLCLSAASNGLKSGSFLWTQSGGIQPNSGGFATALSSNGKLAGLVGQSAITSRPSMFIWTPDGSLTTTTIGYDISPQAGDIVLSPTGVSASGQIVTTMQGDFGMLITGGLWLYLDNLAPPHIYGVQGINDNGQIIAQSEDKAVLLTPK